MNTMDKKQEQHDGKPPPPPPSLLLPDIKILDGPLPREHVWPYKFKPLEDTSSLADIQMDWDDPMARLYFKYRLMGIGVMYVVKITDLPCWHFDGKPVYLYRISYTFDIDDPNIMGPSVIVRVPMLKFRTACLGVRKTLKEYGMGYTRPREDLGPGYVESEHGILLIAVDQACKSIEEHEHGNRTAKVRAALKETGIDYDALYKKPNAPDL